MKPTHAIYTQYANSSELLQWARSIMRSIPMFELSNGSGKFFGNYQTWQFYKDSKNPLVKTMAEYAVQFTSEFSQVFQKELEINFITLAYTRDASETICLRHKDGYFFDGQLHLTILGNASIDVEDPNGINTIKVPNGTFWYLNGTEYYHKVRPTSGERIELLAPVNQITKDVADKIQIVTNTPERYLDSNSPIWKTIRSRQVQHVETAIKEGRASNLKVAAFNRDFDQQVLAHNSRLKADLS